MLGASVESEVLMLLIVDRNEIENNWTARRDDQQIPIVFFDPRDVAAAALLLGATVRTDSTPVEQACRHLSVTLEGDPVPDYDQLGT